MNKLISIITAMAALTSLSSCNIYSKYERSELPQETDSLFRYVEATNDTTTIASLSWRELFSDVKLQALIEEGIENNTDLNIARNKISEAQIALKTSRLAYAPTVAFTPEAGINSAVTNPPAYTIATSASWELDFFGKLTAAKERSKAILEQSYTYKNMVQTSLISTIASSYYSLLALDAQKEISAATVLNWAENIRVMEALKRTGAATEAAVSQAKANKLLIENQLLTIDLQIGQLENTLSTLLARSPQKIERTTLLEQTFSEEITVGVPMQLVSNRPDVKMAEYNLISSFYTTIEARASLYPSIKLSGAAGWTNNVGGKIINPKEWLWSATASLVQPIFSGGKLRANLEISKLQEEQSLLNFNQSILNAANEVNNSVLTLQTAVKQKDITENRIKSLERAVYSSKLLMLHSNSNYLDVLIAENSLLQARLSLVNDINSQISSVVTLYHALGGGTK